MFFYQNVHKSSKNFIINGWTSYRQKIMAFWYRTWCTMTDRYQCFRRTFCLHLTDRRWSADFFRMLVYHILADCNLIIITMRTSNLTKLQLLGWNKSNWIIRQHVTSYKVLWQQMSHYSVNRGTFNMYNTSKVIPVSFLRYLLYWAILLLLLFIRLAAKIRIEPQNRVC